MKGANRSNWALQTDSDLSLLQDRITYCGGIRDLVEEDLTEQLIQAGIVEADVLLFAPVKQ